MMSQKASVAVRTLVRKRLGKLFPCSDKRLASIEDRVVVIVERNVATGRFNRLISGTASPGTPRTLPRAQARRLAEYVDRVLYYIERELDRVDALEHGDQAAWTLLRAFLVARAVRMCRRLGRGSRAQALDFADETCLVIFDQFYPFDVSFEAWATTILKNLVLGRYYRSRDAMDRRPLLESLDTPVMSGGEAISSLGDLIPDDLSSLAFERIEHQQMLATAIDQLSSPEQRQVILDTYFSGLQDGEIARRLGRTKQAVYNLRSRALTNMRAALKSVPQENVGGQQ